MLTEFILSSEYYKNLTVILLSIAYPTTMTLNIGFEILACFYQTTSYEKFDMSSFCVCMLSVNQLMTLLEEEELGEVSIHDLVQNSNDAFQRLLQDTDCSEVGLCL